MSEIEKVPYSAGGWAIGWVVFLGSGYVASVLLNSTWAVCEIGVNASANLIDLVVASTTMAAVSTFAWWLMRGLTGRRGLLLPLLLTLPVCTVLLWPLMAIWHAPDGYPVSHCPPDNVPPWWPGRLPL